MLFYSQETGGAGTEDRTGDVYEKKYSCFATVPQCTSQKSGSGAASSKCPPKHWKLGWCESRSLR